MKCLVLAGGRGDRLWPLSRKNYPKQFISIQKDHSIFQETIARNIPFCDEFIIVTNQEYQFIVENQMKAFQGITYRLVLEEEGRKTTAAILLSCLQFPLSELMFVVASDHLIQGTGYKEDVLRAAELAREGCLVTFGMDILRPETRFGYIRREGDVVRSFVEKPDAERAEQYFRDGNYLINSGMFLFRVGSLIQEIRRFFPWLYNSCEAAFYMRRVEGKHTYYSREVLEGVQAVAIEKSVFEKTSLGRVIHSTFVWQDIGSLEDLALTDMEWDESKQILYGCEDTTVLNQSERQIVVANQLKDITIINTEDAVYVGRTGESDRLKEIMRENPQDQSYFDRGRIIYKPWGTYELLHVNPRYVVRKVVIHEGKTIYAHQHAHRTEHWIIVSGRARIILENGEGEYGASDSVEVPENTAHQISNIGGEPLVFMEISTGEMVEERDLISIRTRDLTEAELGYEIEPFVRLLPAFKDYLWGGTRLRELYGKKCDYDIVAESWELSAHKEGQSIVASGRYRGMLFPEYLEKIGKVRWGWKCQPMERFPLLVKLIDARENLSVQVHPDDAYALEQENEYGKNEMWYILDCAQDACIYCGFCRDVTREEVERAIGEDTILELLNRVPIRPGEAYFIPAGTVHAIGAGSLICEIQQSSACTYRLYDYNRRDKYGNPRELHLQKALSVMDYSRYEVQRFDSETIEKDAYTLRILSRCKYFECASCSIHGCFPFETDGNSFYSVLCVKGEGRIRCRREQERAAKAGENKAESGSGALDTESPGSCGVMELKAGDSLFIPAAERRFLLEGEGEFIISHV